MEKLEKLNITGHKISNNINILENIKFKELKELDICLNYISDIKVLTKVKFEKLVLGDNKISNINILENIKYEIL